MSAEIVLQLDEFNTLYPELNADEDGSSWAFTMAQMMLDNSANSMICCGCNRKQLLYLLAAHLLFLKGRGMGNVGSIKNAHEGSVSVGYGSIAGMGENYFGQSQYGALFWQLVSKYMSGFYVPEC